MKTVNEIRTALLDAVTAKHAATCERRAYKKENPAPSLERSTRMGHLWGECRLQKETARCLQLAYAMARGQLYWHQERNSRDTGVYPRALLAQAVSRVLDCPVPHVKAWMDAPVDPADALAFELHTKACQQRAREAKLLRAPKAA